MGTKCNRCKAPHTPAPTARLGSASAVCERKEPRKLSEYECRMTQTAAGQPCCKWAPFGKDECIAEFLAEDPVCFLPALLLQKVHGPWHLTMIALSLVMAAAGCVAMV